MQQPTPRQKADVLDAICSAGILAIVRTASAGEAIEATQALVAGGVHCIEITYTIPDATAVVARLAATYAKRITIAAGTVLTAAQAHAAIDAGASLLVSPCVIPEVLDVGRARGVAVLPGALTPSEVFNAYSLGADVVKIFPASHFGPRYLSQLKGPLPHIPLLPTGGIDAHNAGAWLRAGAFALGVGSSVVDSDAVKRRDWQLITAKARTMIAAVTAARHQQLS